MCAVNDPIIAYVKMYKKIRKYGVLKTFSNFG